MHKEFLSRIGNALFNIGKFLSLHNLAPNELTQEDLSLTGFELIFSWWHQNFETFSMALCVYNPPGTSGFPSQRISIAKLWCFIQCQIALAIEQILKQLIWDALTLMWHHCKHDDIIKWNIFRITGHLCGEFCGPRWIPHTKASDEELWCLLWSAPE